MSAPPDSPENPSANGPIGYGRPPLATRFKPGRSGNPRGRPPKRVQMLGRLMAEALDEKVEAPAEGKKRRPTKLEAAVKQIADRAAGGDHRALLLAFSLAEVESDPDPVPPKRYGKDDSLVVAEIIRRFSRQPAPVPAAASAAPAPGQPADPSQAKPAEEGTKGKAGGGGGSP